MCVLAQYGIRSKQEYIFRTNAMVEMSGASKIIATAFDKLLSIASEEAHLQVERTDAPFSLEEILRRFHVKELNVVELFTGGGNSTVLFDNEDSFRLVNALYTHCLLEEYPGLIPLCVGIKVGDPWNYKEDYRRLAEAVSMEKNRMSISDAVPLAPFSEIDRKTGQPIVSIQFIDNEPLFQTAEAKAKRSNAKGENRMELDDLVYSRGSESLLAVVHADGNGMGAKIKQLLGSTEEYTECVALMREFTQKTSNIFSKKGKAAMDDVFSHFPEKKDQIGIRWLISDGDDATWICNARYAKQLTEAYLKAVAAEKGYSSCAGICIFHSHYPFYMAYQIAEQCCDSAKQMIHRSRDYKEESWVDFHYLHAGLIQSLDEYRLGIDAQRVMLRPLGIGTGGGNNFEALDQLAKILDEHHVTRTNIKTLGNVWEKDRNDGLLELHRIYY